jgi:hypothetical protein
MYFSSCRKTTLSIRQIEIGLLDPPHPVLPQEVGRLDVAVDQTMLMRRRKAAGDRMPMRKISLTSSGTHSSR